MRFMERDIRIFYPNGYSAMKLLQNGREKNAIFLQFECIFDIIGALNEPKASLVRVMLYLHLLKVENRVRL